MKLYYKPGACSLASHIVLHKLAIPFTLDRTDTAKGLTEHGQQYANINPKGYVPALEVKPGVVITENTAILEYLADIKPEAKLAPAQGTLERVRLREWLSFLSSELHKCFSPFFSGTTLDGDARKLALQKLARRVDYLEQHLAHTSPYLLGEQMSVADIYAFVILSWAKYIGVSLEQWPNVQAFCQLFNADPNVEQALIAEGLLKQEA